MAYPELSRSWTEIMAFRRRDRLIILPLSLLAAAGASMWLGVTFGVVWFVANAAILTVDKLICDWLDARPAPCRRHEFTLAAFTFVMTGVYSVLPVTLTLSSGREATIAGAAIVGGVALSSISEFMISRLVGGAALLALFLACVLGVFWRTEPTSAMNIAFALATVISFFGYVLQAAIHREKTEAQVRTALRAAQSAQEEAAVASAAKSTFLATMSHEIRTPLNGVLGMAQAMAAEELSPIQRERLEVIRESGEALTTILNDVLDLSKIEAGQLEIESVAFDLDHLLHQSRAAFLHLADQKGLELTLSLEAAASGVYLGDPARLRQVIYNLLSNAVKFTEVGEVHLRARREDGLLHLSVADTGVGVAADQMDRLFAKFVQLDASMSRRHGGTGLGLAISRELCLAMGGEIAAESAAGQGSTFTLRLPLERLGASAPAAKAQTAVASEPASDGAPLRILAAEDNAVNRMVLETLLGQAGVTPTIVEDGAKAVATWAEADWDVILMDVHMPVMDGIAAVREIRARERESGRRRTPVIALTANAMLHQIAELQAAGMDHHVAKPIEVSRLFAAIETALAEVEASPDINAAGSFAPG